MKVKELIAQLEQQDPELEVLCFTDDEEILPLDEVFRLFKIESVAGSETEEQENKSVSPPGKLPRRENQVTIQITTPI